MLAQSPEDVVAHMGAMQAQDYAQAVWAIGLRCGKTLAEVEQAIRARKIVRTWLMRGTIHAVTREDAQGILSLTRPRMLAQSAGRLRQLGLDAGTLERSNHMLAQALRTEGELTRAQLLERLEAAGISTAGQRGYHMLGHAGVHGLIAIGLEAKKVQTFVALEAGTALSPDEALARLVERFFLSHGPATLDDFVRWTGLTVGEARRGLAMCDGVLPPPDADGMIRGKPHPASLIHSETVGTRRASSDASTTQSTQYVHLLPGFDEYFIGYKDRGAMLDLAHMDKIVPGGNGIFKPMIVCDGEICGVWSREVKRDRVIIMPAPFRPLRNDERDGVEAAAARYGAFLGMEAAVRWG
jgi:hypothetical protein